MGNRPTSLVRSRLLEGRCKGGAAAEPLPHGRVYMA